MPLYLTTRLSPDPNATVRATLCLTAEERTRTRHYFTLETGEGVYLRLSRGTVLRHGDLLQSDPPTGLVRVVAKPEPVMVVTAQSSLQLLRAAYHLGNRHVPLEVTEHYLRCAPDAVLKSMLEQIGVQVTEAILPFEPEGGAYGSNHSHSHHTHHSHSH
jgi:urease accessory protein